MQSDPRKFLYDVHSSVRLILDFCGGRTLQDYERDNMLRSATERQFEIIGEAMTRLRDLHPREFGEIPDGTTVIAFRNRLIHGYDTVDSRIVWDVIERKLPPLRDAIASLLDRAATS